MLVLRWRFIRLKQCRWTIHTRRLSPFHPSTHLASGAVRPHCGRCWHVPAVAYPLKSSCSRCSPLLAASNSRIALALLSQFLWEPVLSPWPTARHVTVRCQPRCRILRTHLQRPKTRVGWRRRNSRLWRSAGPSFAQYLRDGDYRGASGLVKPGYIRVRHFADTSEHRHGTGRRGRGDVESDAVVCWHRILARCKRYDSSWGVDRGGSVFRIRWRHPAPPHEQHAGLGSSGDKMEVAGSVSAPVSNDIAPGVPEATDV